MVLADWGAYGGFDLILCAGALHRLCSGRAGMPVDEKYMGPFHVHLLLKREKFAAEVVAGASYG